LITSREVLKKVGTFNTEHFIYWDDMDWCTRVKRQGYEIHAINDSRVFHKMGVSNHKNTFGLYYFERNRMLFFLRYLQDDRLKDFSNSIVKWVVPLLFFSNLKGNYAAPKSFLCAIDDLVGGRLGKQENSIFEKCNEKNVFHKYSLDRNDNVVIFMNGDMISNRRVYFYLKEFYNQISICVDEVNYNAVKNNFHEEILLKKELVSTYFRNVFFVCEHILEFQKNEMFDENFIFMDGFLNFASLNDIKLLSMQYEMYKELFVNIHQPMLERSFKLIRNNLLVKERNEDISGA